ncbi:MAG TPA: 3-oxoacyl-[acyl-carrier-protein] reductase [Erysipelotrichaceae bacterium]|nr:3-oxoacyl-[acyl-carrier-protein] reductase [Erysipelotrichaceae bacterium]
MDKLVCLVTGASSGIGRQIALDFAKAGYDLVLNYSSNMASAMEVAQECETFGSKTLVLGFDVSKGDEVEKNIQTIISTFGKIDVLINNSGITRDGLVLRMKESDFEDVIDINLKGAFNCSKAVLKYMFKARSGKIINMTSVIGLIGNAGQANYAASKAGLIGLTKSLAKECATRNINVNAIAPGFIQTRMTDQLSDELKQSILKQIPNGRFGSCEDISNCALFLASNKANYINGQVIQVDGGMVM